MALTRIDNPTPSAPAALADYVQILAVQMNAILQALRSNSHACIDFTANVARAGVVFYVAGVLYKAVTEQAIGGTPSKYVKIDPSGATASIDYVASLAGVTWDDAQSGYYDGSGNLYVFDEARAVYDGAVSTGKTIEGQIAYIAASLNIKSNLTVLGTATITGNVSIDGEISAPTGAVDIADALSVTGDITAAGALAVTGAITETGNRLAGRPKSASGIGQWVQLDSGAGNALNLPSGGTWSYVYLNPSALLLLVGVGTGGGVQIAPASGAIRWTGLAWRIT